MIEQLMIIRLFYRYLVHKVTVLAVLVKPLPELEDVRTCIIQHLKGELALDFFIRQIFANHIANGVKPAADNRNCTLYTVSKVIQVTECMAVGW